MNCIKDGGMFYTSQVVQEGVDRQMPQVDIINVDLSRFLEERDDFERYYLCFTVQMA